MRLKVIFALLFFLILGGFLIFFLWIKFKSSTSLVGRCKNCNILIIDIDILRADAIDCKTGSENTPNICKFLKKSAYFINNISHSDLTRPAFISGLTSLYPSSHNSWNGFYGDLDSEILTLPKILKQHNYRTIFVGYSNDPQLLLTDFDQKVNPSKEVKIKQYFSQGGQPLLLYFYNSSLHFPYLGCGQPAAEEKINIPAGIPRTWEEFNKNLADYVVSHYREIFRPETIALYPQLFQGDLSKKKDEIFALYQKFRSSTEGHAWFLISAWKPIEESYLKFLDGNNPEHIAYLRSQYMKCLRYIDEEILPTFLDDPMLLEKTVVVIKSDHGEEFYEHKGFNHNNNLYQELLATPLVIYGPGVKPVNISGLTQDIDIVPTLLDFLGIELNPQFQGKSLISLMENPESVGNDYQIAQRSKGYITSFRKQSWKLILQNNQPSELYDLSKDPGEKENILEQNIETADLLFAEYKQIISAHKVYRANSLFENELSPERRKRLIKEGYF